MSQEPQRPRIPEIIHRPDLVTATKKGSLALIAAVGWLVWLYMITPLFALLAWWFGYQRLDAFVLSDPVRTLQTLIIYAMIIAAGGIMFILWAVYNWLRFRDHDRRGAAPPATPAAMGEAFAIPTQLVLDAQAGKILAFSFDDHGQIIGIETSSLLAGTPDTPSEISNLEPQESNT
ncbi:MAG: poly-beta-1,6-N-acetyl-D-glucosamine biosynthesis protein PgaD [Halothiobacillus sp.]|jgi:biofilm PGA synthesis protein PgaD|nr:poly-beta-1,6-N-acetyl-D-glucosamine biosynthesis protein PgaD [Halothiobacillus sp.]